MASKLAEAVVTLRLDKTRLARDLLGSRRMMFTAVKKMASMAKATLSRIFSLRGLMTTLIGGGAGVMLFRRFVTPFAMFEQEMDKSLAIMQGATGREDELAKKARQTAKQLGLSHAEAAKGYFFLASAGLNATKSLAAYDTVAKFSVAGSFDMAQATDMLTDSLSALGLASNNAQEYGKNMKWLANIIVKGNTLANTSVSQLAAALMNKGAVAMKLFGLETKDGIATLLAMADVGFAKGTQAGTRMFLMLSGLAKIWRSHSAELREKGIVVYDELTGKMKPMADIVDSIKRAFPGAGKAMTDFFQGTLAMNERAVAALGSIVDQGDKMRNEFMPALEDVGGTMDRIARENLANLMGVWNRFKSTVADLSIEINSKLTPAYEGLLAMLGSVSEQFRDMVSEQTGFGKFIRDMGRELTNIAARIQELEFKPFMEDLAKLMKRAGEALFASFIAMEAKMVVVFRQLGMAIGEGFKEYMLTHMRGAKALFREPTKMEQLREAMITVSFDIAAKALSSRAADLWKNIGAGLFKPGPPKAEPPTKGERAKALGEFLASQPGVAAAAVIAPPSPMPIMDTAIAEQTFSLLDGLRQLEKERAAIQEKREPAWRRSGIVEMSQTIQDAIFGRHEEKIQKDIAKATKDNVAATEAVREQLVELNAKMPSSTLEEGSGAGAT